MLADEAKKLIEQLSDELRGHNFNYYQEDSPTISDYEFDMLLKKLQKLEEAFPQFTDKNSPSKRVGGEITKRYRMYEKGL